jgi:hypothetical protein
MIKKLIIISCVTLIVGIIIGSSLLLNKKVINVSGSILTLTKNELINNSTIIIKGSVQEILKSKWSNPKLSESDVRNSIVTDVLVNIDQIYKGTPNNEKNILVRIRKGTVGNVEFKSDGYPDFITGEDVILFLLKDTSNPNENYYLLTGMLQGKYTRNKSSDVVEYISSADWIDDNKIVLANFKNDVDQTIEFLKQNPIITLSPEEIKEQNEKIFGEYDF